MELKEVYIIAIVSNIIIIIIYLFYSDRSKFLNAVKSLIEVYENELKKSKKLTDSININEIFKADIDLINNIELIKSHNSPEMAKIESYSENDLNNLLIHKKALIDDFVKYFKRGFICSIIVLVFLLINEIIGLNFSKCNNILNFYQNTTLNTLETEIIKIKLDTIEVGQIEKYHNKLETINISKEDSIKSIRYSLIYIISTLVELCSSFTNYLMGYFLLIGYFSLILISRESTNQPQSLILFKKTHFNKQIIMFVVIILFSIEFLYRSNQLLKPFYNISNELSSNDFILGSNFSGIICSLALFLYAGRLDSKFLKIDSINKTWFKILRLCILAYASIQNLWFLLNINFISSGLTLTDKGLVKTIIMIIGLFGKIGLLWLIFNLLDKGILYKYLYEIRKFILEDKSAFEEFEKRNL